MKWIVTIIALLLIGCGSNSPTESTATPPERKVSVPNLSYSVDTVFYKQGTLFAEGFIRNIGTKTAPLYFYVSGEFFKRNSFLTSMGEARMMIKKEVTIGDTARWTLSKKLTISGDDTLNFMQPALANMTAYTVE